TLQNASLNSATAPCTALSLTTDSVNILITGCGDQTLLQFMKTGKIPFGIQSITPNPASSEIDIVFEGNLRQPISYELIDALGITRQRGITQERDVSLDATGLSPGIYFFRATTDDGFAVARKVVIEH
ncbi:MAG TPA: T9SS type A sorting domain-containing protein, partial [Candidatus Kapabacteria bacterium]|nr:T9SS type A sorting domain-containing protein [Candidatus Kapabacteria bacterium]